VCACVRLYFLLLCPDQGGEGKGVRQPGVIASGTSGACNFTPMVGFVFGLVCFPTKNFVSYLPVKHLFGSLLVAAAEVRSMSVNCVVCIWLYKEFV
jgi:hypothetical protein